MGHLCCCICLLRSLASVLKDALRIFPPVLHLKDKYENLFFSFCNTEC